MNQLHANDRTATAPDTIPGKAETLTFLRKEPPALGAFTEVIKGLYWVRLPLPMRLNHVNCWLLEGESGWTMVDCGLNSEPIREIWDKVFSTSLGNKAVQSLVLTHSHPDHLGFTANILDRFHCPTTMTLSEWQHVSMMWSERESGSQDLMLLFLQQNGCTAEEAVSIAGARAASRQSGLSAPPMQFIRIREGDTVRMGDRDWRVIVGGGHSIEHASFYCESEKILIAGDQILSHITPSIVLPHAMPRANPLGDFLESQQRLAQLDPDTLVLPSHGLPFYGLHARIRQTQEHHARRLDEIEAAVGERAQGFAVGRSIFPRAFPGHARQALSETLAHLNWLAAVQRLIYETDDQGRVWYVRP